jgi:hypothetical protein
MRLMRRQILTQLIIIVSISTAGCGGKKDDDTKPQSKLDVLKASFARWQSEKPALYSYRTVYAEEKTWSMSVDVSNDQVVCRAMAEEGQGVTLVERGDQVNAAQNVRPLAQTLDDLYQYCLDRLTVEPELETVYFESGYLSGCYLPSECKADWCKPEVVPIHSLTLGTTGPCSNL